MSAIDTEPARARAMAAARADLDNGRPDLVIGRLRDLIADPDAPDEAVRLCATALRRQDLNTAAIPLLERVVASSPASAVAEHNLAAALGDLGDVAGAAAAARRALDKGGKAPETWLVLGRALQGLGRLAEAETAFRTALGLRPGQIEARRDLAQLVWMRTADRAAAMAFFDPAGLPVELQPPLLALGVAAMIDMEGERAAYDWLSPRLAAGRAPALQLAAARAAGGFDPRLALKHAEAALEAAPEAPEARMAVVTALMGDGRTGEALPRLEAHLTANPLDQYAIALRYTAWRILSDPRALGPDDYATLVRGYTLQPPDRQPVVSEWMGEVAQSLRRLHAFQAHPFDQSIRQGVQTPIDPRRAGDPVLDEVFTALDAPIDDYVRNSRGPTDAVAPDTREWQISGAWSVRLGAGGRHTDHVHPRGRVSSALHVALPPPSDAAPRAGWLRFGATRLGIGLELPAEYWVEPRPGRVVLFPSWMWHGTEPLSGPGERLTIAFDVQPR